MISERKVNREFANWFEHWRARLEGRILDKRTLREEGQRQLPAGQEPRCQDLAGTPSTSRNDAE
jgi:hypothetical protein